MSIRDRDDRTLREEKRHLEETAPARNPVGSVGELKTADDELEEAEVAVTEAAADGELPKPLTQRRLFVRRFFRHKAAVVALLVLVLLYLSAIFAPAIAPYEVNPELNAETLARARQGPSADHWFGTDDLGNDQFTRVLFAGRISLLISVTVALVSTVLGTAVGATAGFLGGRADQVLMRITDLFLVVPGLALLMIAKKGLENEEIPLIGVQLTPKVLIVLILSFLFWQTIARVVRGLFLSLKEKEYVEAARASGASNFRIITRHILPNCIGPIVVNTTLVVGVAILIESTLSFLGFGFNPPTVSWGTMVNTAKDTVGTPSAYMIYFPGLAILVTVLAINFLGDGLRDALDPQAMK